MRVDINAVQVSQRKVQDANKVPSGKCVSEETLKYTQILSKGLETNENEVNLINSKLNKVEQLENNLD